MIVFDIESGPQPWHQIEKIVEPFDEQKAVPHPGEFDPASVKCGNLKPENAMAKIDEARRYHEQIVKSVARSRAAARNKWVADWMDKAPLDATIGCVKAIGYLDTDTGQTTISCVTTDPPPAGVTGLTSLIVNTVVSERVLLMGFWEDLASRRAPWAGHNIHGFDLPFLMRRSYLLGIDVPRQSLMKGRYFHERFVDTMIMWQCGGRDYVSLDRICKALGIPGKGDECSGKDFHRMFDAGGDDRVKALAYLAHDLEMTLGVAEAMGVL
jgi:hypothetical protein